MTVGQSVGALCLANTMACYLSSLEPHLQMDVLNTQLVPILRERGVSLHWRAINHFMLAVAGIDVTPSPGEGREEHLRASEHEMAESEDAIAESTGASPCSLDCESMLSQSHSSVSAFMLAHMIPESVGDQWLSLSGEYHSLSYLLCSGLIHTAWNKWPLVVDPQDLASQFIKQRRKDLTCLDASNR